MRKLFFVSLLFFSLYGYTQNCTVSVDALKGTYDGDCKDNKANGTGTAKGEDSYTGEFKKGYPEGKGKYTWKNGEWFDGEWKKGVREGQGTMHFKTADGKDSTQTGFWKKNNYIGKHEKPYVIYQKTPNIVDFDVTKETSNNHVITFNMESTSGGASSRTAEPKATITDIAVISGQYISRSDNNNMPKTSMTVLRGVEYPFRLRVTMGSDNFEIEFLEEGSYTVDIRINR